MGIFDFFKKKTAETPKVTEQTDGILEIGGIQIETAEPKMEEEILLNVESNSTTAINQAIHGIMDEEDVQIYRGSVDVLYEEDKAVTEDESFADEDEIEVEITTALGETYTADDLDTGTNFIQELSEIIEEMAERPNGEEEILLTNEAGDCFVPESEDEANAFVEALGEMALGMMTEEVQVQVETREEVVQEEKKKGFFAKLVEGLDKTRKNIMGGVDAVLGNFTKIDEDLFEELEEALIMADMGMETTMHIVENLRKRVKREHTTDPSLIKGMLADEITAILTEDVGEEQALQNPTVMLVIGVNGVGKTTTIGKMSYRFKEDGHSVLLAAADTFRAAAIDQLEIWGQRSGIEVIKQAENSDPAAVVYDAVHAARNQKCDLLICDTAGRLHNKKNLMEELRKIGKVIEREHPTAHKEVYLVLDATTGQNALQQAKLFQEVAEITGIILTKLDGTAKGGIVVAIKNELKIPVRYIGVGEGIHDLQKFDPRTFAQALFGE